MEHNFYSEAASKADLNTEAQLPQSSMVFQKNNIRSSN